MRALARILGIVIAFGSLTLMPALSAHAQEATQVRIENSIRPPPVVASLVSAAAAAMWL
jgi:hypothetical protein